MSKLTEVLKLFCYDPETDGNLTFNVTEALTKNWEKIDQLVLLAVAAAAAYDPEGSYAVGDYCTHGGGLHKCGTAIPDGEAWNAAHWTETSVASELAEVRTSLSNKADKEPLQTYNLPLADGWGGWIRYGKDQFNKVLVYGLINKDSALSSLDLIANFPEGFIPIETIPFVIASNKANSDMPYATTGYIRVQGDLRLTGGSVPSGYVVGNNLAINFVYVAK